MIYNRAEIEINLDNIIYNIEQLKKNHDQNTKVMAVVKTDAYGHGACYIAKHIESLEYLYGFGVATVEEGIALRKEGIEKPILVLGATFDDEIEKSIKYNLTNNIYNTYTAKLLSQKASEMKKEVNIHISVDTGMSRLGFNDCDESIDEIVEISKMNNLKIDGIFSHFAKADETDKSFTNTQIERFNNIINKLKEQGIDIPNKHISNSAGTINFDISGCNILRLGIAMYGINPTENTQYDNLKPVLSLRSRIIMLKNIKANTPISYGGTFISKEDMKIAVIPIGYGDGLPRTLSNKGYVIINDKKANIVGRVCMDLIMVDVSNIDGLNVGDEVIIIGASNNSNITVMEMSNLSNRFYYEILCLLNKRIPRIYLSNGKCKYKIDYFS